MRRSHFLLSCFPAVLLSARVLLAVVLLTLLMAAPLARAQDAPPPKPHATDGNRLAYLDVNDPFYPHRDFPKLTTPMWVGEDGVEAVVVLSIDDMRDTKKYEQVIRPILDRLKQVPNSAGKAPFSIFTNVIDPNDAQIQAWLKEGVSIDVHTIAHPCPLCAERGIDFAKQTVHECVDLLAKIPNSGGEGKFSSPVCFRMPCCDSINSVSPRFFAEIFNKPTAAGHFMTMDSSVFVMLTPNDPALPRDLVLNKDGTPRFAKYVDKLAKERGWVGFIEDYPYPYVINKLCWELPVIVPSDWEAQNLHGVNNPATVDDWKAALDAIVIKQGVMTICFHPHGWIKPEQIVEFIDYAQKKHGGKVRFLNPRQVAERLTNNVLDGNPLWEAAALDDAGVRMVDLNDDQYVDVVVANDKVQRVRLWDNAEQRWVNSETPPEFYLTRRLFTSHWGVAHDGAAALVQVDTRNARARAWTWNDERWVEQQAPRMMRDVRGVTDPLIIRDVGSCMLVQRSDGSIKAYNPWQGGEIGLSVPKAVRIADDRGRDAGLRFVDLDDDGDLDIVFSNAERYGVYLFEGIDKGWSRTILEGTRENPTPNPKPQTPNPILPSIIRADGTDNGFFIKSRALYWQNEDTGGNKPTLVTRIAFDELLKDQAPQPKSPEASRKCIEVRPGFKVELVAAEPLVFDPVAFSWGPDGRLWVAEMADYPGDIDGKREPGTQGGRVVYLEDSDHDGKYDKRHVFLDDLQMPNGVLAWRNGVLVTTAPSIIYAEDTGWDGRADKIETLFTGFVEGNPQLRVNGLSYGLDGWVYGANGLSGGKVKSEKTGKIVDISGRDFRINPDTGDIEAIEGQSQFGRNRDDFGNWFGCNNSEIAFHFVLPEEYLRRNPNVKYPDPRVELVTPRNPPVYPVSRTLERIHAPYMANRFTSICSTVIYRDTLLGDAFYGNVFACEPVHNVVTRRILTRDGVTFTADRAPGEETREFLASRDHFFRPVFLRTGPDGALWIADMYRREVEHPRWVPKTEDAQARLKAINLRQGDDKGRIWRVVPVDAPARAVPRLDDMTLGDLAEACGNRSGTLRDLALMQMLWKWDQKPDENQSARSELWHHADATGAPGPAMTQAIRLLSRLDGQLFFDAAWLMIEDEEVRRAVITAGVHRVNQLAKSSEPTAKETREQILKHVLGAVTDKSPVVRLELAFQLGSIDDPRAGTALGEMLAADAANEYIGAAVLSSARGREMAIAEALLLSPRLAHCPHDTLRQVITLAVTHADPMTTLRLIGAGAPAEKKAYAQWQFIAMSAFLDALAGKKLSLAHLADDADERGKAVIARSDAIFEASRTIALDPKADAARRTLAIALLGRAPGRINDDVTALGKLLDPATPGSVQLAAVDQLARLGVDETPGVLLDKWVTYSPTVRGRIVDVLLRRDAWAEKLLDHVAIGVVKPIDLAAADRQRLLTSKSDKLRTRANELLGVPTGSAARAAIVTQYKDVLTLKGDPRNGAALFQKNCAACHRFAGVGNGAAPDLASLTDRSPATMLESVLDPNRAVEPKYTGYIAEMKSGDAFVGMLVGESGAGVTMVAADGTRRTLLRSDIDALRSTGLSFMPEGLERGLSKQDFADLFAHIAGGGAPPRALAGVRAAVITPGLDKSLYLWSWQCEPFGEAIVFEEANRNLGFWSREQDYAAWTVDVATAGGYEVWLDFACDEKTAGNGFIVEIDSGGADERVSVKGKVPSTGTWSDYQQRSFGRVELKPGRHRVTFRSDGAIKGNLIDLRGVRLAPVK